MRPPARFAHAAPAHRIKAAPVFGPLNQVMAGVFSSDRVEPPVVVAAVAVAYLLAAARVLPGAVSAAAALLLAVPALLLGAAVAVTPARWRGRRLLLAAAAGCVLAGGLELGTRLRHAGDGAGLPLAAVDELHGVLARDDRPYGAAPAYRLAVERVGSTRLAAQASARFTVDLTVSAATGERGYRGRRVVVRGVTLYDAAPGRGWAAGRGRQVALASYTGAAAAARAAARGAVERLILDQGSPAAALLLALLLGDRHHLPAEEVEAFRRAGALHLLALSGLHVGLVYALAAAVGRGLTMAGMAVAPQWQRLWVALAAVVGVGAVFLYVELAGARPSLARATTMLALARLAAGVGRRPRSLNVLALSAIVVVATDPPAVHELSFQLSYAALLGILLVGPWIARRLPGWLPPVLRSAVGMAVGAQAATLPLVLAVFGRVHPIGMLSGLVLVPCTALFLWTGIACLALSVLSEGAFQPLTRDILHLLYSALTMLNDLFGQAPGIRW